ncbi:hypothetical protein ADL29_13010 [Streptomyces chattanoogensis]|uniref:Uncharacterized protein n=2 Tax=Streptomyces chattanoogensis TaxID=66876 RepID=A0A0N0XZE3_9ACTN|nr:hypothetical protein ADL29_13010 [Streptomyces chattanoogensis]
MVNRVEVGQAGAKRRYVTRTGTRAVSVRENGRCRDRPRTGDERSTFHFCIVTDLLHSCTPV